MSVGHAVTRSVRDSALLLDLTSAPCPGDPSYAPRPERSYLEEVTTQPGLLRIGLIDQLAQLERDEHEDDLDLWM